MEGDCRENEGKSQKVGKEKIVQNDRREKENQGKVWEKQVYRNVRLKRSCKEIVTKTKENLKSWRRKILLKMVKGKRTKKKYCKRNVEEVCVRRRERKINAMLGTLDDRECDRTDY